MESSGEHICHKLQEERRTAESIAEIVATKCPALRYISFQGGLKATTVRDADGQLEHLLWSYERRMQTGLWRDDVIWTETPAHDRPLVEQLAW